MRTTSPQVEATLQQIRGSIPREQYIQSLFDPVQTHAVYGVYKDESDQTKEMLKKFNATRFRVVKVKNSPFCIVCFKLK